jgi:hypothetical protein
MIGKPTLFMDGLSTVVDFDSSSVCVIDDQQLSVYRAAVNPMVALPGGGQFDVWEGADLPTPLLAPVEINVRIKNASWYTMVNGVAQWEDNQGRHGTMTAVSSNGSVTETVGAKLDTVNVKQQWNSGAVVALRFVFTGDWS